MDYVVHVEHRNSKTLFETESSTPPVKSFFPFFKKVQAGDVEVKTHFLEIFIPLFGGFTVNVLGIRAKCIQQSVNCPMVSH